MPTHRFSEVHEQSDIDVRDRALEMTLQYHSNKLSTDNEPETIVRHAKVFEEYLRGERTPVNGEENGT